MSNKINPSSSPNSIHPKRPFSVRLLGYAFAFWSLLGWLRFIRAVMERELVLEILSKGIFVYLVATGLFWGVAALPVIWGLVRRWCWTKLLTWVAAVLFPAIYWFERLVLWRDQDAQGNWLFMLLLTLFWFGLAVWALKSKPGREYFSTPHKGNT